MMDLKYFKTELDKEISWKFFVDFTNPTKVSKEMYPEAWEIHKNVRSSSSWSIPQVNKVLNFWKENDFIEKIDIYKDRPNKKRISKYPVKHFRFNLDPFFIYCKDKNIILDPKIENIIKFLFKFKIVREKLFKDYKQYFFYEAILEFLVNSYIVYLDNKSKIKLENSSKNEFKFNKNQIDMILKNGYINIKPFDHAQQNIDDEIIEYRNKLKLLTKKNNLNISFNTIDSLASDLAIQKINNEMSKDEWIEIELDFINSISENNENLSKNLYISLYSQMDNFYPNILLNFSNIVRKIRKIE